MCGLPLPASQRPRRRGLSLESLTCPTPPRIAAAPAVGGHAAVMGQVREWRRRSRNAGGGRGQWVQGECERQQREQGGREGSGGGGSVQKRWQGEEKKDSCGQACHQALAARDTQLAAGVAGSAQRRASRAPTRVAGSITRARARAGPPALPDSSAPPAGWPGRRTSRRRGRSARQRGGGSSAGGWAG